MERLAARMPPLTTYSAEVPSSRFQNRDLSWLEFDRRVLAMAEDPELPLLERARFLAIFSQNLDEFFQVRVALHHAELEDGGARSPDGLSSEQTLHAIRERVLQLSHAEEELFAKELRPSLATAGIEILDWAQAREADRDYLERIFQDHIFPVLTPLAVDPAHPFPYVSNLSFNLAALVRHPETRAVRFARIKVPPTLGRFVELPDGHRFLPIEQLIGAQIGRLFPGMEIESQCPFRVTRDADLDIEEDSSENLLHAVESGLRRRRRLSDAVRVEADRTMSLEVRELLLEELDLDESDVYVRRTLLDLGALRDLYAIDRPDLKQQRWVPRAVAAFAPAGEDPPDVFERLKQGDVLVHHPYESFESSVSALLDRAASDPNVLAIKHTVYRTSTGPENPIGRTLMRAAQNGKQVVTMVELQARFDEAANIDWARQLEQAGVHVVYGQMGLKTHGKIMLVVRREGDQIRRYCHVGTGNYNPVTARIYEDVGILSADPDLCADLAELFNQLTGFSLSPGFRRILRAPDGLRPALLEMIREETSAADGHIVIKVNNLSDPGIIDALYEASQAGVRVDLVVRSICCLRPGIEGLSENIRVRSIVGPFLEHSRLFRFGSAERGYRYLLGSADLMSRNLDHRVEVVTQVEEPEIQGRIEEVLQLLLADDRLAWELENSEWQKVSVEAHVDSQAELQRRAALRLHQE